MDNLVFERDYAVTQEELLDDSELTDEIIVQALTGGFLTSYAEALNAVPKVVIPEYKENYEYVLQLCDGLAKTWGGSIRGVVSYETWEATIDVTIPYVEFTSPEELRNLQEIAEKSHGVSIQPVDDGFCIHIYNKYFEDCISGDGKTLVVYESILKDKKLSEMLGLSTELPPEFQPLIDYFNGFLDAVESATGRSRADIFKEFLSRMGSADEAEDIYKTIERVAQDMISGCGSP